MVVEVQKSSSQSKDPPGTVNAHQSKLQVPMGGEPLKKEPPNNLSLMAECIADEMAKPEEGISAQERAVWGEVFQSRQNFVDMHFC